MRVYWLINQYASTPQTGLGGRHFYLANALAKQGHIVYLVGASYTHLLRNPPNLKKKFTTETISKNFKFVWVKVPYYPEAHNKKRIFNWFLFTLRLLNLENIIKDKPDTILFSSPSPFPFLSAQRLAKKFGSKLAFEVRDIWPLTLVNLGGYSSRHPFIKLMQWVEDKAYQNSDMIISNLPNAFEHIVKRGFSKEKVFFIPNGFEFSEVMTPAPLGHKVKNTLPKNKFIVGYVGTIGMANALDPLIAAADLLKNEKEIAFLLVGDGKQKQRLINKAGKLDNITFIDSIPKNQVQSLLREIDIAFVGELQSDLYKYGVAFQKIPEYLIASKPVLHLTSFSSPIEKAQAGIQIKDYRAEAICKAILKYKRLPLSDLKKIGENGRRFAIKNYDYAMLAKKLSKVLS